MQLLLAATAQVTSPSALGAGAMIADWFLSCRYDQHHVMGSTWLMLISSCFMSCCQLSAWYSSVVLCSFLILLYGFSQAYEPASSICCVMLCAIQDHLYGSGIRRLILTDDSILHNRLVLLLCCVRHLLCHAVCHTEYLYGSGVCIGVYPIPPLSGLVP